MSHWQAYASAEWPKPHRITLPSEEAFFARASRLAEFIALRDTCADLEALEDELQDALVEVRQERSILSIESEALGRRLSEDPEAAE